MSTNDPAFNQKPERVASPQGDYLRPIAREGEAQFACIMRNRSGIDSGCIDFGLRSVTHLSHPEQQEVCDIAYALYQAICDQTGKRAKNETSDV